MRADLPKGTVTFLFTDVEGSTRLLAELGADAYAAALAQHRRVIRQDLRRCLKRYLARNLYRLLEPTAAVE